jgi:hypothetical protein
MLATRLLASAPHLQFAIWSTLPLACDALLRCCYDLQRQFCLLVLPLHFYFPLLLEDTAVDLHVTDPAVWFDHRSQFPAPDTVQ